MTNLEELNLHLVVYCEKRFIDGYDLKRNIISRLFIIIMSLRLSARWGQPFTRSDFSMPVDLAQGGTGHVHCADT
ncbi:unnamed protein product, partial [Rotaria magnacalcarata]